MDGRKREDRRGEFPVKIVPDRAVGTVPFTVYLDLIGKTVNHAWLVDIGLIDIFPAIATHPSHPNCSQDIKLSPL